MGLQSFAKMNVSGFCEISGSGQRPEPTKIKKNVNLLSKKYNVKFQKNRGTGEFIGGETRIEGLKEYNKIIQGYESKYDRRYYGSGDKGKLGLPTDRGISKTSTIEKNY